MTRKWAGKTFAAHPGYLHRALGIPKDQPIPEKKKEAAAKKGGRLGRAARLAMTAETFKH